MSQDKETWTLIGSGYISTARFFSTDFHPLSRGEFFMYTTKIAGFVTIDTEYIYTKDGGVRV